MSQRSHERINEMIRAVRVSHHSAKPHHGHNSRHEPAIHQLLHKGIHSGADRDIGSRSEPADRGHQNA